MTSFTMTCRSFAAASKRLGSIDPWSTGPWGSADVAALPSSGSMMSSARAKAAGGSERALGNQALERRHAHQRRQSLARRRSPV